MTILPQAKHFILPVTILMLAAPQMAFAQSSTSLSGLYACELLAGDAAQLACFRAETAKIRASDAFGGSVTAETQRLAAERERLAVERQRLAAEKESLAKAKKPAFNEDFEKKPDAPKSQTLAITQTKTFGANGYTRFTLKNGEVWQQTESARIRLGRASPDMLVVKKGTFGGYIGKVNDKRPTFRVKRVK
ncbi:hypothetical protein N9M10_02245 [Hellea sp.]|nr:hypothetical protein [Hellea sp.]